MLHNLIRTEHQYVFTAQPVGPAHLPPIPISPTFFFAVLDSPKHPALWSICLKHSSYLSLPGKLPHAFWDSVQNAAFPKRCFLRLPEKEHQPCLPPSLPHVHTLGALSLGVPTVWLSASIRCVTVSSKIRTQSYSSKCLLLLVEHVITGIYICCTWHKSKPFIPAMWKPFAIPSQSFFFI